MDEDEEDEEGLGLSMSELPELADPGVSEELDPPLAEFVLLLEDEEELSGLELKLLLGGVEDPADEDDDELGGVALLPVPALPVLGRCSPQAANAAATAATVHSFANVRKVLSMSALLESGEKADASPGHEPAA